MVEFETKHYHPSITDQVPTDPKKVKILENYLELCEEIGVAKVTLQKVASKAGISLGNVHYHFGGKENLDLETAAIRYVSQESVKFINSLIEEKLRNSEWDPLDAYVESIFSWSHEKTHHGAFFLYYYYVSISEREKYGVLNEEYVALMHSRISSLIYFGIGKGLYKEPKEIKNVVTAIHAQVVGQLILSSYDPREDAGSYYLEICKFSVKKLMA